MAKVTRSPKRAVIIRAADNTVIEYSTTPIIEIFPNGKIHVERMTREEVGEIPRVTRGVIRRKRKISPQAEITTAGQPETVVKRKPGRPRKHPLVAQPAMVPVENIVTQ